MRVYIAGPMTGYPHFNFDAFDDAVDALENVGVDCVSPSNIDRAVGLHPDMPVPRWWNISFALRLDFAVIDTVDALVLLPGWEGSDGVAAEIAYATRLGKPFIELDEFLSNASQTQEYV